MPQFQASLLDGNSQPDLVINCTTDVLTITDTSNYDTSTEDGNERADFTLFRKIIIGNSTTTLFTFSSLGDGDATMQPASSSVDTVTFATNNGDDVYQVTLYTVPTWDQGANYEASDDFVYFAGDGKLYKALTNNISSQPPNNPTDWLEVVETDLTTKYCQIESTVVICDLNACALQKDIEASCEITTLECNDDILCTNKKVRDATYLDVLRNGILAAASTGRFQLITPMINLTKKICSC